MDNKAKPRVLVVDDEHVIADTLAIILNQAGFDASAVYTGSEAVDVARTAKPDLIITDVILAPSDPTGMNGIEAAIHIRGFLPVAKYFCFPVRPPRPICWKMHARVGTSLRF